MADWREGIEAWLIRHDTTTDLLTVWVLVICFAVWATVRMLSWWSLRGTHDKTAVGRSLKLTKAADGVMGFSMSVLYGLSLWAWYAAHAFGPWWKLGIRVLVAISLIGAALHGVAFIVALRREIRKERRAF